MKQCNKCKRQLPATEEFFHKHSGNPDGLAYACKECVNEKVRRYQRNVDNRGKWKEMSPTKVCTKCGEEKKRNTDFFHESKIHQDGLHPWCKECSNKDRVLRKYNISEEKYDNLFKENKDCCMICGKSKSDSTYKTLCIDHSHENGIVIGLLCDDCNQLLGRAHDNTLILIKAVEYLKENN